MKRNVACLLFPAVESLQARTHVVVVGVDPEDVAVIFRHGFTQGHGSGSEAPAGPSESRVEYSGRDRKSQIG
jgi:hypothetical protein